MLFLAEGGTYRLDRHAFVFILLLWVLGANCNEAQSSGYRVERGKCTFKLCFKYVTVVLQELDRFYSNSRPCIHISYWSNTVKFLQSTHKFKKSWVKLVHLEIVSYSSAALKGVVFLFYLKRTFNADRSICPILYQSQATSVYPIIACIQHTIIIQP